jgi:hypothetical protein
MPGVDDVIDAAEHLVFVGAGNGAKGNFAAGIGGCRQEFHHPQRLLAERVTGI